jgi:hypothetical protein
MDGRRKLSSAFQGFIDEAQSIGTKGVEVIDKAVEDTTNAISGKGTKETIADNITRGLTEGLDMFKPAFERTFTGLYDIYKTTPFYAESPSPAGLNFAKGFLDAFDLVSDGYDLILQNAEGMAGITNEVIESSGLNKVVATVDEAGVVANANITTLLSEYQEKIKQVQGLVDAPDKIANILSSMAEMKETVDLLIKGLQEENAKPIKLVFDSKGAAEKALVSVLKDYVGDDTGRVAFEYEDKTL